MNKFMIGLQQLLGGGNEWSLSRAQLFFTTILSNAIVWPTWLFICIKKNEIVNIPEGVGFALGIACGVSGAIYGYGKREERLQRQSYTQETSTTTSSVAVNKG